MHLFGIALHIKGQGLSSWLRKQALIATGRRSIKRDEWRKQAFRTATSLQTLIELSHDKETLESLYGKLSNAW
jgi:hypothetical protein